jgi:photosystem II stability/assembly factor-like uncharacterized protein
MDKRPVHRCAYCDLSKLALTSYGTALYATRSCGTYPHHMAGACRRLRNMTYTEHGVQGLLANAQVVALWGARTDLWLMPRYSCTTTSRHVTV